MKFWPPPPLPLRHQSTIQPASSSATPGGTLIRSTTQTRSSPVASWSTSNFPEADWIHMTVPGRTRHGVPRDSRSVSSIA